MKTLTFIRSAVLTASILFIQSMFGAKAPPPPPPSLENWRTVDDFANGVNHALTMAPNGALFAAGSTWSDQEGYRGVVKASMDDGNTWFPVSSSFVYPGLLYTIYSAIASDPMGNLYVSGIAWDDGVSIDGGPVRWIVQRSTDQGATWSLVDDYAPGGWWWLYENTALAVDSIGNVFCGFPANGGPGSTDTYWIIRKGVGGGSFTTVDTLASPNEYGPQDIYVHATAGIFAVGDDRVATVNRNGTTTLSRAWIVRRSLDGGSTWQTINTFQLSSGSRASATGVGGDAAGNLYVVGRAFGPPVKGVSRNHWVVRRSANGGNSWTTVDDYQIDPNNFSIAQQFVAGANGDLYVAGYGAVGPNDGTGRNYHWIVRKSVGGTGSWTTVDDFQYLGTGSAANSITADAFGKILVGGWGGDHWLVRRSP